MMRTAHRLYAGLLGYFWLPCPLCGDMFGGHEWKDRNGKCSAAQTDGASTAARGICPTCTKAGRGCEFQGCPPGTGLHVLQKTPRITSNPA